MRHLFLLICFLAGSLLTAQTNNPIVDSLLIEVKKSKTVSTKTDLLIEISKQYRNLNPNEGIKYGNEALALATKNNLSQQTIFAMVSISDNYYNLGDIEKSLSLINKANSLAKTNTEKIETLLALGKIYLSKADYKKALQIFYQSLSIAEKDKNDDGIMSSCYYIGVCYNYLMLPNKAIHYYSKSMASAKKLKNDKRILAALLGIGGQYEFSQQLDKAHQYYSQSLKMAYKQNDPFSIGTVSSSFGNLLFRMDKIDEALKMIKVAKEKAIQINNYRLLSTNEFLEGRIYLEMAKKGENYENKNLLAEAEHLLKNCIETENELGNINVVSQSYELLSEIYTLQNDYKKAKEYYVIHNKYQDSIYNEDTKQTIQSLEDERTIAIKNKEIEINKLKLSNQKKQTWFLIAGLAFLGILGGLLFYQSRNRKKTNEKLQRLNAELDEANKAKTRFFSILNHDLRGPVANLVFFLQLQKESPEMLDEESIQRMQDKTMAGAENLLASMEDILQWSKSQMENFKPQPQKFQIATLFEDTQKHFLSVENIQFQFENPSNLTIVTDENYLKTIVRNLTGNAVKALGNVQNPTIVWKAFQENGATILSITDNGKGASQEEFKALYDAKEVVGIKTGLGLHLIRDLAKAIECEISVNSKINEGTTITLKL